MSKIIKNTTGSAIAISDTGISIPASPGQYTIPAQDYLLWAASSNVITYIGSGALVINDGSVDLSISDGTDLIKGIFPKKLGILSGDDYTAIGHVGDALKASAAQSGTWTVQPGNTANTTPWLATANQGTPNSVGNAWPTKITDGTDTVGVTTNGDQKVSDGLRNGGVQGALTLTTANTAYEAKVGGSRLSNRKLVTITANDDMYWGYDNTVTISTGTLLFKNQQLMFSVDPDSTFQVWLVASANSKTARITESP